jgi:hypothetical protein
MTLRSQTLLLTVVLALGAGCRMPDGRTPTLSPMQSGQPVAGSATVTVRIGPPGLSVQTVPMTFADVATVVVTLKDSGNATVSSPGLTNPITITLPALTGSFTGVPPGTGYTIAVDARDATGTSITGGTSGSTTVDVAGGVATYSAGSALVKTIDLTAGTASTDASSSTITPATGTTLTFDRFKWMLLNNRSKMTVASSLQATAGPIAMTAVQPGATSGATHELWLFGGVAGSLKALPVQRVAAAAQAAGTIPNPFNGTMAAVALSTPTTTALLPADLLPMTADDDANVYYVTGGNAVVKLAAGNGYAATTLFTAAAAPTSFATDGAGNVYYSTGNDIQVRRPPLYGSDTTLVTTTGVGRIAIDEFKNLYWINGASVLTYAAYTASQTYQTIVDGGGAGLPLSVPGATMLAADAFGHVYSSNGTDIVRRARSHYGFWNGQASNAGPTYPSATTVVSASNINGFTVDRAGDVYFTQAGSNELKLVPCGGTATDHFTVAGSGTTATPGATTLAGDPLATADFRAPLRPAVTRSGVLFCTSVGDDNVSHYLRRIQP